jgi:hypothetical protein
VIKLDKDNVFKYIKNKLKIIRSKNNFLLWIGVIIIILLFLLTFILLRLKTTQKSVLNEDKNEVIIPTVEINNSVAYHETSESDKFELPNSTNPEIVDILGKIYSIFDVNNNPSMTGSISVGNQGVLCYPDNGNKMWDSKSPSVRWLIRAMDVKKNRFANFDDVEIEEIKKDKTKILSLIKEELIRNHFVSEKINLADYSIDFFEYDDDYYVFSKNEIKCVVSSEILNKDYTAIAVKCSDQYKKNYQYKIKLIDDLKNDLSENAINSPLGEVALFDRYGIFTFIGRGTYFQVVGMMDANDKWHILWQGQSGDGIPCEILDEYPIVGKNYSNPHCYYKDGSYSERD